MKYLVLLTILVVSLSFVVAIPLYAAGLSINPGVIDTKINPGGSSDVYITAHDFNGVLEIRSEDLPVDITPKSIDVVNGTNIRLTLNCSNDVASNIYVGRLVFLTRQGASISSSISVPCNLNVGNANPFSVPVNPGNINTADPGNKKLLFIAGGTVIILILGFVIYYLVKK